MKIKSATWKGITPREWQKKVFKEIVEEYSKKKPENCIVNAIMGSGKTEVIAEVCARIVLKKNEVVAVTTDTQRLVEDIYKTIRKKMPDKVGMYYAYDKAIRPITIICNKSFPAFLKELKKQKKKLVFVNVDEAHHSEATDFKKYLKKQKCPFLGYTATAFRTKTDEALTLFTRIIYKYGVSDAIRDKVIVDWVIRNNKYEGLTNREISVKMIKKEKGIGVANADNIDDALSFTRYLKKNGIKAVCIHYRLRKAEKDQILEDFSEGKIKCLVHINMLKAGVDFPFIKWSLLRKHVTSRIRFIQEVGRPLRCYKDKDEAIFLDPHDHFGKFNITQEEALGGANFVPKQKHRLTSKIPFSDFEYFYDNHSYKVIMSIESLIRNIQTKLALFGLKITRNSSRITTSVKSQRDLIDALNDFKAPDKQWIKFVKVVRVKLPEMKATYCKALSRILQGCEIIGFVPKFDKKGRTIAFTKEQMDQIRIFNVGYKVKTLTYRGRTRSLRQWSLELDIALTKLLYRFNSGWPPEEIINGRPEDDLIGVRFGNWIVIDKGPRGKLKVQCDCKAKTINTVFRHHLKVGRSQSCGCMRAENRAILMGDKVRGINGGRSKLTEKQVINIYKLTKTTMSFSDIGKKHGVGATAVSAIKTKTNWKHLTDKIDLEHLGLTTKEHIRKDVCIIEGCGKKYKLVRGLCPPHYQFLKGRGLLKTIALPKGKKRFKETNFKVKRKIEEGVCRIVEDEISCENGIESRGLCVKHYSKFSHNKSLELYGTMIKSIVVTLNAKAPSNKCRMIVNRKLCKRPLHGRGLCTQHYNHARRRGKLDYFGLPPLQKDKKKAAKRKLNHA